MRKIFSKLVCFSESPNFKMQTMRANCTFLISYNVHWISMVSTWESSKSWRVCDQIETLGTDMLPNVNDHATKLTLFDKDFHVPWLPILTRKKRSIHFFPSLFSRSI